MPKVNINDVDHYNTGGGGGGFLQLKKDKEKVQVRFMLEELEDLSDFIYVIHNCKTPDNQYGIDVNCLREYDDPVDVCPLCAAKMKQQIKAYIPVWNEDEEKAQIWSRGKRMIPKMQGLMERYEDFPSHLFTIQRNGKENSQDTTYEIYEDGDDDITLDDLDELPIIEGFAVKNYSADDMEYYLESGEFPPDEDDEEEEDIPRRKHNRDSKSSSKSTKSSKKSKRHDDEEDVRPRHKRHSEPEDDDEDDEEEEEERPVRKSKSLNKKKKHRPADEF